MLASLLTVRRSRGVPALAAIIAACLAAGQPLRAEDRPAGAIGDHPALSMIPSEARMLLSVDVSAIRNRPGLIAARDQVPVFPRAWKSLEEFLQASGLDPSRDLDAVTIGGLPGRGEKAGSVLVARGRIGRRQLAQRLEQMGWRTARHRGHPLLVAADPASSGTQPSAGTACAVPRHGWALWGDRAWVEGALDVMDGQRAAVPADAVMSPLIGSAARQGEAWIVIGTPRAARQAVRRLVPPETLEAVDAFAKIDNLVLSARAGEDIFLRGEAGAADEDRAGLFADALRAAVALLRMGIVEMEPAAFEILGTVRIDRTGRLVTVTGKISGS